MHVLLAILFAFAPCAPVMPFIGASCGACCSRPSITAAAPQMNEPAPLRACCAAANTAPSPAPATCDGSCCGANCPCGPGCMCSVDRAPPATPLPAVPAPASDQTGPAPRTAALLVPLCLAAPASGTLQAYRPVAGGDPAAFGRARLLRTGTQVV